MITKILDSKKYSGLVRLAALVLGFGMIVVIAHAAAETSPDTTTDTTTEIEAEATVPERAPAHALQNAAPMFVSSRLQELSQRLETVRARRRLLAEALESAKTQEATIAGQLEEAKDTGKRLADGGLWICEAPEKEAAK